MGVTLSLIDRRSPQAQKQGCYEGVSVGHERTTTSPDVIAFAHSTASGNEDNPVTAPVFIGESKTDGPKQNAFGNFIGDFHLNLK
jgi:hypothetical protein